LEVNAKKSVLKVEITKKKVPRKEIMHFSRQMGVFMKAGIPIMEALEVISLETTEKLMKKVILEMIEDLRAGDTFTAAARSHPEAFPNFYVGILESAELTGNLDTVLNQLADYIERDVEARSTLTSALIYPAVVAFMSVGVVVVLATFVMPRFVVFFNSLHAKLPLPTRMLLAGSSFFSHNILEIIGFVLLVVVGFSFMRRSVKGRAILDGIILKLPVLGLLVQAAVLERVCRVLSSMIRAGHCRLGQQCCLQEWDKPHSRADDGGSGTGGPVGADRPFPWRGQTDVSGRRGDRNTRYPTRDRCGVLPPRA